MISLSCLHLSFGKFRAGIGARPRSRKGAPESRHGSEMRLHIGAKSSSRQSHAVGLQAQALQSVLLQLLRFEHGGPRERLPLPSHVLSVLSVVYTTKNRENINCKHDRSGDPPRPAISRE